MINELLNKSKEQFLSGSELNEEKKMFDFFVSELDNTYSSDRILIRPSQLFGLLSLLRKEIPDIKHNIVIDSAPSYSYGIFDEGQIWLELSWDGAFPGTGTNPTCFVK